METDDHFDAVGRERNITQTQFAYHDGYYEGIELAFRGFGAAASYCDATARGGSAFCRVSTRASCDRGFGALHATDPNGRTSEVNYDGLGRLTAVHPLAVAGDSWSQ